MKNSTFLLLVTLWLAPIAANAGVIQYDFVGTGSGGSTGYLQFDDVTAAGGGNIMSSILDWSFSWNGQTIDSSNSFVASGSSFTVDMALDYLGTGPNTCFTSVAGGGCNPEFFVFNGSLDNGAGRWRMNAGGLESGVQFGMNITVGSVPEPYTLILLALGLIGSGLIKRRSV